MYRRDKPGVRRPRGLIISRGAGLTVGAARHATPSGGARTSLHAGGARGAGDSNLNSAGRLNSCIGERREESLHYSNHY